MKKILLTTLILLLTILLGYTIINGWQIGNLKVLGISEIKNKNAELDKEINNANRLANIDYKKQLTDEDINMKTLEEVKEQYHDLVVVDTESGEEAVPQLEKYEIEYLWTQIGNHAKEEGVTLKINVEKAFDPATVETTQKEDSEQENEETTENNDNKNNIVDDIIGNMSAATVESTSTGAADEKDEANYDLMFEASGSYVSVADFIYAIENDSSLGFKIEDFEMTGSSKTVTARFACKDIRIKKITQTTEQQEKTEEEKKNEDNENTTKNTTTSTKSTKTSNTTR